MKIRRLWSYFWPEHRLFFVILGLVVYCAVTGNRWGLPSPERNDLFFPPSFRTDDFYAQIAKKREEIYKVRISDTLYNISRLAQSINRDSTANWELMPKWFFMNVYSSFLVRSLHGDDQLVLATLAQVNPLKGKFALRDSYYGGVYVYGLGAFLKALEIFGRLRLVSDITFYYKNPQEMARIFGAARAYSALNGIILLGILYALGVALFDKKTAFLACLLWISAPVHLFLSHVVKPHLPSAVFGLSLLFCSILLFRQKARYLYRLGGALGGMALGATTNAYPLLLSVPLAHLWRRVDGGLKSLITGLWDRDLWTYAGIAAVVFYLTNFWIFLDIKGYLMPQLLLATQVFPPLFNPKIWVYSICYSLTSGLGPAVFFCAFAGILYAAWTHRGQFSFLAFFFGLYLLWYAIHCSAFHHPLSARYFVPGLLLMVLFASYALRSLWNSKWRPLGLTLTAAIVAYQAAVAHCYLETMTQDNPRESASIRAGRWINQELPPGSSIGMNPLAVDNSPPFFFHQYQIYNMPKSFKPISETVSLPKYFILSTTPSYQEIGKFPVPYENFQEHYKVLKEFKFEGCRLCRGIHFENRYIDANYSIRIYKTK